MVLSGFFSPEADYRRLFLDEARRRVLNLLEELNFFGHRYRRWPPPWIFERLSALAGQVAADDASTSLLDESLEAVEAEIRNALAEMAAVIDADTPIPYRVPEVSPEQTTPHEPIPAPVTLRPFLTVLRGGQA